MKLTKYAHSCLTLEEQGKKLVVDPGSFSKEFGGVDNVVGVVVTHIHPDHFNADNLAAILQANPDIKIFTTPEIVEQWKDPHAVAVKAGDKEQVGPFTLEFFGEKHSEIHSLKPVVDNIGIMVNDALYYPGDSLTSPERPVKVLALPSNAPWVKMSETIEYLKSVKPSEFFFPTHNGLLSEAGHQAYEEIWLNNAADAYEFKQSILQPGDSVEI